MGTQGLIECPSVWGQLRIGVPLTKPLATEPKTKPDKVVVRDGLNVLADPANSGFRDVRVMASRCW